MYSMKRKQDNVCDNTISTVFTKDNIELGVSKQKMITFKEEMLKRMRSLQVVLVFGAHLQYVVAALDALKVGHGDISSCLKSQYVSKE